MTVNNAPNCIIDQIYTHSLQGFSGYIKGPPSMHLLLLPFLFFVLCLLLLLVSLDIDPVLLVLDLHMKYTVKVVPLCTYIVWFVIVL